MGQLRVASAEQFLRSAGLESVPPVLTKLEFFRGRPANEVDRLRTLELQALPRQRLFTVGTAGGSGGGASGGQGATAGQGSGGQGSGSGGSSTR